MANVDWRKITRISAIVLLIVGLTFISIFFILDSGGTFGDRISGTFGVSDTVDTSFVRASEVKTTGLTIFGSINLSDVNAESVPSTFSYDPRLLLPVRDQGQCATCVPFTLCSTIGDRIALGTNQEIRIPLSVQNLVSCSGAFENCTVGSNIATQLHYIAEYGVIPEELYPYTTLVSECSSEVFPNSYRAFIDTAQIFNVPDAGESTITLMQVLLREQGPLVATIEHDDNLFRLKKGEVYELTGEAKYSHAIEIIGYHKPNEDLTDAFWVIKNSWGTSWPQGLSGPDDDMAGIGFIKMGSCSIEQNVVTIGAPIPFVQNVVKTISSSAMYVKENEENEAEKKKRELWLWLGIVLSTVGISTGSMTVVQTDKLFKVATGISAVTLLGSISTILAIVLSGNSDTILPESVGELTIVNSPGDPQLQRGTVYMSSDYGTYGEHSKIVGSITYNPYLLQPQTQTSVYYRGVLKDHTVTSTLDSMTITVPGLDASIARPFSLTGSNFFSMSAINQGEWIFCNATALYKVSDYGATVTSIENWTDYLGGVATSAECFKYGSQNRQVHFVNYGNPFIRVALNDEGTVYSGSTFVGSGGGSFPSTSRSVRSGLVGNFPAFAFHWAANTIRYSIAADSQLNSFTQTNIPVSFTDPTACYVYQKINGDVIVGTYDGEYATTSIEDGTSGWSILQDFSFARVYEKNFQICGQYLFLMSSNVLYCHDIENAGSQKSVVVTGASSNFNVTNNNGRYTIVYTKQSGSMPSVVYSTDLITWSVPSEIPIVEGSLNWDFTIDSLEGQFYSIFSDRSAQAYSVYSDKNGDMNNVVQVDYAVATFDSEL